MASLSLARPPGDHRPASGRRGRSRHWRVIIGLALAGLLDLLLIASPFVVHNVSMDSFLHPGELMLVDRLGPALQGLGRGEIVLFHPPVAAAGGDVFIKRVIALPGETVSIHGGSVYVNGQRLLEPYLAAGTTTDARGLAPMRVPPGRVFVLGDNRGLSWDSRGYGAVPIGSVVGQAWLGYDVGRIPTLLLPPVYAATAPPSGGK